MTNEGLNKTGRAVDSETGETVMEMFGPPNALTEGANILSQLLYGLSEVIIRGLLPDTPHGRLGGEFGYAPEFENEVFVMHPDGWCEEEEGAEDCWWCQHRKKWDSGESRPERRYYDPPLFLHKASNFRVTWYKWIGRDMATNRDITGEELQQIFLECWESIPQEARNKAQAEHEFENTPEFIAERQEKMAALSKAIWESIEVGDFKNPWRKESTP